MKRVSVAMPDDLIQMVDRLRKERVGSYGPFARVWSRDAMCAWLIGRAARSLIQDLEPLNQPLERVGS